MTNTKNTLLGMAKTNGSKYDDLNMALRLWESLNGTKATRDDVLAMANASNVKLTEDEIAELMNTASK